jgi:hypothetical protein
MKKFKVLLIALGLMLFPSCSKKPESTSIVGEGNYNTMQMQVICLKEFRVAPVLQDSSYQFFNETTLEGFYSKYKKELFDKGVVKWNNSFDCNRFTLYFSAMAQIEYFAQGFGENGNGQAIGVGEVYYVDDVLGPHAINILLIKGGFKFFEPQIGKIKYLSSKEKLSVTFIKF